MHNKETVTIEINAGEATALAECVLVLTTIGIMPNHTETYMTSLCKKIGAACEREAAREVAEQTLSE